MPPRLPGLCPVCGEPSRPTGELCWSCEEARSLGLIEPPSADEDTRPAKLCPPRMEPSWKPGRVFTVECDPQDHAAEQALAEMGYTLTAEMKDPRTGVVTSHVWAKILDEDLS